MQRQRIRFQRIFDRQRFQREARQRKRQVASVALRSLMVKLVEYSDSEEDSDESLDPRNARAWAAFDTRHKRSASTSADVAARHELQQNGGLRKRTSSGAAEAMDAFTSAKRSSGANPVVTSVTYTHVVTTDPMTGHESVTTRYEVATTAPADAASGGNHAHGVAAAATASSRPAASLFAAQQYSEHIDRKYGFGSAVPEKNAFGGATAQWTQQPMAFDTSTYGQSASRFEQGEDEEEDEDSHEHEEDDDDDEIDNDDSEEDEEDEDETEQEENAEEFEGLSVTGRQQQHVYFDHGEDEDVDLDENYYGEKADEDDDDDGSSIDIEQDDDHERRESHEYESAQDVDYDDEEKSGSETEEGVLPPASSSAGERKSRMFHWEDENMDDKASTKSAKVTSESKGQASATVNGSTAQSVFTNAFGSKETVSNLPWTFGFSSTSGCQTQTSSNNSTKQGIFSSQSWQSQQPSPFAASQGSIFSAGTMSTSRSAGVRRRSRPMAATTTFQRTSDKRTTVETVFGVKDGDAPSSATRTFASMPFTFRSRVPASSGLFSFGSAAHSDDAHSSRQESRSQFTFGQSTSSESESSTTSRGASPLFAVGNKNPLFAPPKPIFGAVDTMSKDSSVLFTDIFKPASTQSEDTSAKVQSALGKDHEANFWFTVPHSDWNCAATKPPTSDEKEAQPGKQSAFTFNENASSGVGNRAVGNKPSSKPAASAGLFSKGMQSPNRERIAAKRRILIPSRTTPIQGRRPTTSEPHVSPAFGSSKFASQSPFTFPAGSPPQDTPISHHGSTTAKQFVFGSTPKVSTTPGASSNANPFVFGVGESTSFPKNGTKIFVTAPRFQGVFGSVKPSSESPFSAPASTAQQAASAKNSGSNQGAFVFGSTPQPVHAQSQSSSIGGENARFPFGMQNPSTPFQFGKVSSDNTGRASGPEVEPLKSAFGDFTIGSTSLNPTGTTNHRVRRRVNSFSKWKSNIRTSVNEEPVRKETEAARAAKPSFGFAGVNKDSKSFVDTSTNPFAVPSFDQRKKAFATNCSQWRTGNDGKPNQPHSAFETTNAATENGSSIFQKREAKMSTVEEQLVTPTKGTGLFGFAASTATQTMSSEKSPFGSVATGKSLNNIQAPSVKQQPASTIKTVFGSKSSQATQAGNSSGTSSQPFANRDRRILRAMLPKTASFETKEPNRDTEDEKMEDERTWGDLKELGGAAYSSRRYQEAAEYYRQSIDLVDSLIQRQPELKTIALMKDKAKLHSNRAASLMMMMQIIEAQRECRSSIEADPLYSRAYLRLCRVQVLLGDMEHAKQNLINARRIMQSDSHADSADLSMIKKMESTIEQLNVHTNMIKRMIEVKDLSSALDQLSKALALAPNSRALQLQKAQVLFQLKNYHDVVQHCNTILKKQLSLNARAMSSRSRNGKNEDQAQAEQEISILGIELALYRVTALHYQGKADEAWRLLSSLENVAPTTGKVIQTRRQFAEMKDLKRSANELFKRGEFHRASVLYSQALQVDPNHDEYCSVIYCNRAAALMGLERYNSALLDCEEALQRKPHYPRALLRRARCYVAINKFEQGIADFDRYLSEQPSRDLVREIVEEREQAKQAMARAKEEAKRRKEAKKRADAQRKAQQENRRHAWNGSTFYHNYQSGNPPSGADPGAHSNARRNTFGGRPTQPKPQTHYDVLGVHKSSSQDDIRKAYRKLALVHHPDKAKDDNNADMFKTMTAAYNVLSDSQTRATYDRELLFNSFG